MDISFKKILIVILATVTFSVILVKNPSLITYLGIVGITVNLLGAVLYIYGELMG